MAEKSSFFNSVSGDRKYKAEDWAAYFATFVSNGVVLKTNATLAVSADGGSMSVTLGAGSAFYNGYRYENTEPLSLTIPTANASLNRIDAVMIRWNRNNRAMNAYVVQGTASATPAAPSPGRTADIGELCVATVYVAAGATSITQSVITDKRLDTEICGIATMIGELDTSTLYAQIQAALAEFEAGAMAQFTSWFADVQQMLGEDVAGNLLNLIAYHAPTDTSVSVPASGWTGVGPYAQTVTVAGLLATDTPLVDVTLSGDTATALAQLEAYGYVGKIVTGADSITLTCLENKPEVDLIITLKVVR